FCAHAKIWNRASGAAMAQLQIHAAQIASAPRGDRFCAILYLLCLVRAGASSISVGTFFAHVPGRLSLCLALFTGGMVAALYLRQFACTRSDSRVTTADS